MNRYFFSPLFVISLLVMAASAAAAPMTVDDVIRLKQMGFSEAEIQAEMGRIGEPLMLSEDDVKALHEAGFSEQLIVFLRNPKQAPSPQPAAPPGGSGQENLAPTPAPAPTPAAAPQPQPTPPTQAPAPVAVPQPQPTPPTAASRPETPPSEKPPSTQSAGPPPQLVARVQEYLTLLGYQPGPVDGVMGERTRRAIEKYQRDHALPADGRPAEQLVAHMRDALLQRPQEPRPAQPSKSTATQTLVGSSAAQQVDQMGNVLEFYLELLSDGTFNSVTTGMGRYAEAQGVYEVRGRQLLVRNQYGQTAVYNFRLEANRLVLDMPENGLTITYTRQE